MLGKGLESLIPNKSAQPESSEPSPIKPEPQKYQGAEAVFQIEVEKIFPNPHQPRKVFDPVVLEELAASIREMGVLQPLIVTKKEVATETGTDVTYELVAGERRLRAAKMIGLPRVPAIVRFVPGAKDKLEMAIVENVQRSDLNPIEAARSYARLQEEFGLTQREIAARLGKSRETISNLTRLLNLPTQMQDAITENKLSESQGRLLLSVSDQAQQQRLFQEIIDNNISVRDLKEKIANLNRPAGSVALARVAQSTIATAADPQLLFLTEKLEELLGTKITLQKMGRNGKLIINFYSDEELRVLIDKLNKMMLN